MSQNWSLNIRVVDAAANPLEMVTIAISESPTPLPDIAALTGSDGLVSLSVPSVGEYEVTLQFEDRPVITKRIRSVENDSATDLIFESQ